MFELKITASTVEEMLSMAAALGAMGSARTSQAEVPLPEARVSVIEAEAPNPRGRPKRVLPVTDAEQAALDEPEEAMHVQTPEAVAEEAKEAAELVLGPQPHAPAEPEPEASSGSGTIETSQGASSEEQTAPDGTAPTASPSEADLPKDLTDLITATETVETWADFKQAMGAFQKTALYPTLSADQQNHIRASAWDSLVERGVGWAPDPAHDVSAFRLYIEAEENPDQIRATLALLKADPEYQAKSASMREQVEGAATARLADLDG